MKNGYAGIFPAYCRLKQPYVSVQYNGGLLPDIIEAMYSYLVPLVPRANVRKVTVFSKYF